MRSALHIDRETATALREVEPFTVAPRVGRQPAAAHSAPDEALLAAADEAVAGLLSGNSPEFLAKVRQSPGE